jgi:uncharacterized protein (TIGR02996 family)
MMDAAFLEDITENPDDDAPRLIYADWLDDNGQADRAEFIRLQCALARLSEDDPNKQELQTREKALLLDHERDWLGALGSVAERWAFRRGFLQAVALSADTFLKHADAIFAAGPVREVRLHRAEGRTAALADCPHLDRVVALSLAGSPIGAAGLDELLSSAYLGGLRVLLLWRCRLGDRGAEVLAAAPCLQRLADLRLDQNDIRSEGVRALVWSRPLSRLRRLDLSRNTIGDAGAEALASASGMRGLRKLYLVSTQVGSRGVSALVQSGFWPNLVELGLAGNPFGDAGANELLAAQVPSQLGFLSLGQGWWGLFSDSCEITASVQQALREHFGASACQFDD